MTQIKAVAEKPADPKAGQPRRMSAIAAPYYNIDQSVHVAKVIYERAGGSCDRPALAEFLGYKGTRNGSFLTRVTAAKLYGFVDQENDQIRVTERGRAAVAPINANDAARAKLDAFMSVELFKRIFDEYNGAQLPPEVGLKNMMLSRYGLVPDRAGPSVAILLDSAEQAGLFSIAGNRSKMIRPSFGAGVTSPPKVDPPPAGGRPPLGASNDDGGGVGGGTVLHPAIMGLLKSLPVTDTPLSDKRRAAIVAAFEATINNIYGDFED